MCSGPCGRSLDPFTELWAQHCANWKVRDPPAPPTSHVDSPTWRGGGGWPGLGGGQQGDKGACLPRLQPGYKKPAPVGTGATLPCSAQWEEGKGFPWLPHQGKEYSDQTGVKGSHSELQPEPGFWAGEGGRGQGAGGRAGQPHCWEGQGGWGEAAEGPEGACARQPLPPSASLPGTSWRQARRAATARAGPEPEGQTEALLWAHGLSSLLSRPAPRSRPQRAGGGGRTGGHRGQCLGLPCAQPARGPRTAYL